MWRSLVAFVTHFCLPHFTKFSAYETLRHLTNRSSAHTLWGKLMGLASCCACRIVAAWLVLVLGIAPGLAGPTLVAAQDSAIYDPLTVERLLFAYPLPTDDVFWIDEFERKTPAYSEIDREFQILTFPGIITYRVFHSTADAYDSIDMRIGDEMPVGLFIDDPTDGRLFHNRLVEAYEYKLSGKDAVVFSNSDSTSVCLQEHNVVVCGFSSSSWSDYPDGAAMMAAIVGMALLFEAT